MELKTSLQDDIQLPSLVEDDNQHKLEETDDSMTDDDVGTTDDATQAAGPLHEKKFRAEKRGSSNNIKYPGDKSGVCVSSCEVLPTGDIVVCDKDNRNIKLFDDAFAMHDLLKLEMYPRDSSLSLNDNTHVLVTIPDKNSIYTIKVDKRLKKGRKLRVDGECHGITCLVTGIAVTVKRGGGRWEIQLLQYDGQLLKTILPDTTPRLELDSPFYMTSISGARQIVIAADPSTECLTAVDVDTGRVEFVYNDPSLGAPTSLTSDNNANIYVVGRGSATVHVISRTGEKIRDILTGTDMLDEPRGLCYNKRNGTLIMQPEREKTEICGYKIVTLFRAEKIQTYDIECPKDKSRVNVVSCVVLPTGDIVVCDSNNRNIKLFDDAFTRRDLLKLEKSPYDSSLTLDDDTQILVTIPEKKSIYIIKVDNRLIKGRELPVDGECYGITCLVTGIAVTVKRYIRWEIQLLQYDGQLLKTILPDATPRLEIESPFYMTSISGARQIVISDSSTECLTAVDVDTGRVEFVYRDHSLRSPRSVTSDNEDNIYVAGMFSDTVHVISRTGEKIGDIVTDTDGLYLPRGVCYNKLNNTLLLQPSCRESEICVYKIV